MEIFSWNEFCEQAPSPPLCGGWCFLFCNTPFLSGYCFIHIVMILVYKSFSSFWTHQAEHTLYERWRFLACARKPTLNLNLFPENQSGKLSLLFFCKQKGKDSKNLNEVSTSRGLLGSRPVLPRAPPSCRQLARSWTVRAEREHQGRRNFRRGCWCPPPW